MAATEANPGPDPRMTREEYRRWAEQQPKRRFERIDGVVVAMAPERASDADRKALVRLTLRQAVAAAELHCHVYPDGTSGVEGTASREHGVGWHLDNLASVLRPAA
jgi:Uma2 family endonuclease